METHTVKELVEEAKAGAKAFLKYQGSWIQVSLPSLVKHFLQQKVTTFSARVEVGQRGAAEYYLLDK